jgi:hypothetical protein
MIRAMKVLIAKGGCPSLPPPTKTWIQTESEELTHSAWQNGAAQAIPAAMDLKPKSP